MKEQEQVDPFEEWKKRQELQKLKMSKTSNFLNIFNFVLYLAFAWTGIFYIVKQNIPMATFYFVLAIFMRKK